MEGKAERQTGGGSRYLPMARVLAESEANAVHGATAGDAATPRDASRSAMIESGGAANRGGGFDAKRKQSDDTTDWLVKVGLPSEQAFDGQHGALDGGGAAPKAIGRNAQTLGKRIVYHEGYGNAFLKDVRDLFFMDEQESFSLHYLVGVNWALRSDAIGPEINSRLHVLGDRQSRVIYLQRSAGMKPHSAAYPQPKVAFELGWGGKPPGESTFVQGILKEFKFRASQRSTTATITFTPTNADHCEIPIREIKLTPSTSPTEHVIGIRINKQKDVVINCKVVVEKDKGEADPLSPQSIRPIQVADPPASQLAAKDTTWAVHLQFSEFKSSLKDDFGDYRAEAPPLTDGVVLERTAWRDGQLKPFTDDHKAVSKLLGKGDSNFVVGVIPTSGRDGHHPLYLRRTMGFLHGFSNRDGNRLLPQEAVKCPHMKLAFTRATPAGVESGLWKSFVKWFDEFAKTQSVGFLDVEIRGYFFYILPAKRGENELELWFYLHKRDTFDGVFKTFHVNRGQILVLDLDKTVVEQQPMKGKCPEGEGTRCWKVRDAEGTPRPLNEKERKEESKREKEHIDFYRIHTRPGWKELKETLTKARVCVFVRTHAAKKCFGKPAGGWVWDHLDPADHLKARYLKRINCDPAQKSLRRDFNFSWQVPFTMIFDDVNNIVAEAKRIWDEKDHKNLVYIQKYEPSKHDFKRDVEVEDKPEDRELTKQFAYLTNAREPFIKQFDHISLEIREKAQCTKLVEPWYEFHRSQVGIGGAEDRARSRSPEPAEPREELLTERVFNVPAFIKGYKEDVRKHYQNLYKGRLVLVIDTNVFYKNAEEEPARSGSYTFPTLEKLASRFNGMFIRKDQLNMREEGQGVTVTVPHAIAQEIDLHKNGGGGARSDPSLVPKAKAAFKWMADNAWSTSTETRGSEFFLHMQPESLGTSHRDGGQNDMEVIRWAGQLKKAGFKNIRIVTNDKNLQLACKTQGFAFPLTLADLHIYVESKQSLDVPGNLPINWKGFSD